MPLRMIDLRALFAERDDQRFDAAGDLFDRPAGLVAHQFGFVIVDRYVGGKFNHATKLHTFEESAGPGPDRR